MTREAFGRKAKKVRCIDTETNEVVREYESLTQAAKALGKLSARPAIINVCNGLVPTAYGYKWEYIE